MKNLIDVVNENINKPNYSDFITIKTKTRTDDPTLVIIQSKDKKFEYTFEVYKGYSGWETVKNPHTKGIFYTLKQLKEHLVETMYKEWYG